MTEMHSSDLSAALDPRQTQILQAAWRCFSTYGFRKSSMADIAKGAGMSRPALYQYYRNKEDIFRATAAIAYDLAEAQVAEAIEAPGTPEERLSRALQAQCGTLVESLLSSPHAAELQTVSNTIAADVWLPGEARLRQIYAAWLIREAEAGTVTLTAPVEELAEIITWSVKGLKAAGFDVQTYRARVETLARTFARGIR